MRVRALITGINNASERVVVVERDGRYRRYEVSEARFMAMRQLPLAATGVRGFECGNGSGFSCIVYGHGSAEVTCVNVADQVIAGLAEAERSEWSRAPDISPKVIAEGLVLALQMIVGPEQAAGLMRRVSQG